MFCGTQGPRYVKPETEYTQFGSQGFASQEFGQGLRGFGPYYEQKNMSLRLSFGLSSSEFVQNDKRFVRNLMVTTRTSGFELPYSR
eukprot:11452301-Heterocapsa_arctica.AAC.1